MKIEQEQLVINLPKCKDCEIAYNSMCYDVIEDSVCKKCEKLRKEETI